jgi:hypothetical protein
LKFDGRAVKEVKGEYDPFIRILLLDARYMIGVNANAHAGATSNPNSQEQRLSWSSWF